jgi:hypothetical protein
VRGVRLEFHADLQVVHALEGFARHHLDQLRFRLSVAFVGGDHDVEGIARLAPDHFLLQARERCCPRRAGR